MKRIQTCNANSVGVNEIQSQEKMKEHIKGAHSSIYSLIRSIREWEAYSIEWEKVVRGHTASWNFTRDKESEKELLGSFLQQ